MSPVNKEAIQKGIACRRFCLAFSLFILSKAFFRIFLKDLKYIKFYFLITLGKINETNKGDVKIHELKMNPLEFSSLSFIHFFDKSFFERIFL